MTAMSDPLSPLKRLRRELALGFACAGLVTFFVNLSLLFVPLYDMILYDRVLQSNIVATDSTERPVWTSGAVESITDHVARRGAMELAGYADNAHPAWGESVRLSFERWWWMSPSERTLPAKVVETSLRPSETLYEVVLTGTDS